MGWIPGWDSITSAGWWSGFYFWISISCLIGLGIAEVASHRYGVRKDELASIEEDAKDKRHDADVVRLQNETAHAIERAALLEKEAAEARVELARLKLPRNLTPEQQNQISQIAGQFPGTPFVLTIFNDPEAISLMGQIEDSLIAGGWIEQEWAAGRSILFTRQGKPSLNLNSLVGLYVQADASKSDDFTAPVALIANRLKADGMAALSQVGPMPSEMDKNVIFIQVGKKPI